MFYTVPMFSCLQSKILFCSDYVSTGAAVSYTLRRGSVDYSPSLPATDGGGGTFFLLAREAAPDDHSGTGPAPLATGPGRFLLSAKEADMEKYRIRVYITQDGREHRLEFTTEGAYQTGLKVEHALRLFGPVLSLMLVDEVRS